MEKEESMESGVIGTDFPKNAEEMEEDFLERIYSRWSGGEDTRLTDFVIETGESKKHLRNLAKRLMKRRYIEMADDDVISLTDIGKIRGKECLDRHHRLTQFFQMVSGMGQEEAERDACRVEHTISRKGMEGISDFLLWGDVYDRKFSNMDLSLLFEPGRYDMAMEIYEIERRNPRVIAKEWELFEPYACLEVHGGRSSFYLRKKDGAREVELWYRKEDEWIQAAREKEGYCLESSLFTYTVSAKFPVTEGSLVIAVTGPGREPLTLDCREINIHIV